MSFSLSGIASGLDTNAIISQLMQLERVPYTRLQSKQSTLNSQVSVFRTINTKLSALRTAAEDLLLKSNFNLRSATNSDATVLKATVSETAAETSYQINVTQLAKQHIVMSDKFNKDETSTLTGTFKVNGQEFSLGSGTNEEVLTQLMNDINARDVGVKASIVTTNTDQLTLVLTSAKHGEDHKMVFGSGQTGDQVLIEDAGGALTSLGLVKNDNLNTVQNAQNAKLTINGIQIESSSNQLDNVITGLSLTLAKTGETTIDVTKDSDKIAEKVEAFVKAYNDVINTIKSNTTKGKDLQGDSTLRSLENHLSNMFNRGVGEGDSSLKYLFDIGLEIDKGKTKASEMTGTITFDKEKFKEALAENPEEVFNMFALDESSSGNFGIAKLFRDSLMDWTRSGTGIIAAKIDGYDQEISFLSKQMEDMQARLDAKEEQLKKQFVNMETALAILQNQQAWLASQIASLGHNN